MEKVVDKGNVGKEEAIKSTQNAIARIKDIFETTKALHEKDEFIENYIFINDICADLEKVIMKCLEREHTTVLIEQLRGFLIALMLGAAKSDFISPIKDVAVQIMLDGLTSKIGRPNGVQIQ